MVLAISFGISVFCSVLWFFYSLAFVFEKTQGASLLSQPLPDFTYYIALIIIPIFLIWIMFGFISQFIGAKVLNKNLYSLFQQMKKNQDYTDLMARLMLESEQQIKDGFILDNVDVLIADLNEILSEVIYRTKIASKEQIDLLWQKSQSGGKWAFAKVIIEVWQNQTNFVNRLLDRAQYDVVLAGSILEFCARYLSLVALLEKHDKDKVFMNLIEAGVLGKVFSILAPVDDEIKKRRGGGFVTAVEKPEVVEPKTPILSKIFKKKEEEIILPQEEPKVEIKDEFSMALERSFSVQEEPRFEISSPQEYDIASIVETGINVDVEHSSEPSISATTDDTEEKEEIPAYPFGNWMK